MPRSSRRRYTEEMRSLGFGHLLARWTLLLGALVPLRAGAAAPAFDAPLPRGREALAAHLTAIFEDPDTGPPLARLAALRFTEHGVALGLELTPGVSAEDLPPAVENRFEVAVGALSALAPELRAIELWVRLPGQPWRTPGSERGPSVRAAPPPRRASVRPDPARYPFGQALRGRTVALSPGHGYIWFDSLGAYSTQRSNIRWNGCGDCRGITEDFGTHELAVRHLVPLLEGAGARVVLLRDRSYEEAGSVIDDGEGGYREPAGAFSAGQNEGGRAGDYRVATEAGSAAEWRLRAQDGGPQLLSFWFVPGSNRLDAAELLVEAPGGRFEYLADLGTLGRRWAPIGVFELEAGEALTVRLTKPLAADPAGVLVADAVRLGAGVHDSGRAWWRMGAEPFAEYQEAPASVQSWGDVTIRPVYAEWFGADVYLSLHSNASGQPDSAAAGSASYRFSCRAFPDHATAPDPSACDDPSGSHALLEAVHGSMVEKLREDWDPAWIDRGIKVANFGELRELDDMPGVLIESAFHDNVRLASGSRLRATDNQSLHDPRWRRAAAYGIYRGISRYFDPALPLLRPPPRAVAARRVGAGSVEVAFESVEGARGYRIYLARGGRGFDQGQLVNASPARFDGLPAEAAIGVRVATLNEAGEGLVSRAVTARASTRRAQVLVVDAFEREDAYVQELDNRGDTGLTHGLAIAAGSAAAFDGATEAAVRAGLVELEDYEALVLSFGRESTEHGVLTPELRAEVQALAEAGGAVFASGSEVGWALDARGDAETRGFLEAVFGARYAADDAGLSALRARPGGLFAGAVPAGGLALAGEGEGLLGARSPDALMAAGGIVELTYGDGDQAAALRRDGRVLVGAALDSVLSADGRGALLGAWLDASIVLAPPDEGPRPDAGVTDAGEVADVGEGSVDAARADAGEREPDAGAGPDAGRLATTRLRRASANDPVNGGCGCRASTDAGGFFPGLMVFGLLPWIRRKIQRRVLRH
jgi:N-acetylmuramoyl-L-alanine amidase